VTRHPVVDAAVMAVRLGCFALASAGIVAILRIALR